MRGLLLLVALAVVVAPEVRKAPRRPTGGAPRDVDGEPLVGVSGRAVPQVGAAAVAAIGAAVRGRVPALHPSDDAVVGGAAVLLVPTLVLVPIAGVLLMPGAALAVVARRRRVAAGRAASLRRALPDTVDLLRLAVGAGATPRLALSAAARHGEGPMAVALLDLDRRVDAGSALADELDHLGAALGEPVLPLVGVLRAAALDGAPIEPALDRLADELRADRRRHAEADARRLPVKLLFPLVCCALPALVLLSIVPLLVGTIRSLHL